MPVLRTSLLDQTRPCVHLEHEIDDLSRVGILRVRSVIAAAAYVVAATLPGDVSESGAHPGSPRRRGCGPTFGNRRGGSRCRLRLGIERTQQHLLHRGTTRAPVTRSWKRPIQPTFPISPSPAMSMPGAAGRRTILHHALQLARERAVVIGLATLCAAQRLDELRRAQRVPREQRRLRFHSCVRASQPSARLGFPVSASRHRTPTIAGRERRAPKLHMRCAALRSRRGGAPGPPVAIVARLTVPGRALGAPAHRRRPAARAARSSRASTVGFRPAATRTSHGRHAALACDIPCGVGGTRDAAASRDRRRRRRSGTTRIPPPRRDLATGERRRDAATALRCPTSRPWR